MTSSFQFLAAILPVFLHNCLRALLMCPVDSLNSSVGPEVWGRWGVLSKLVWSNLFPHAGTQAGWLPWALWPLRHREKGVPGPYHGRYWDVGAQVRAHSCSPYRGLATVRPPWASPPYKQTGSDLPAVQRGHWCSENWNHKPWSLWFNPILIEQL